jgi:hypothetical protein
MDLLTNYARDSELQAIRAPPPISTIHKSPLYPLSLFQSAVSSQAVPWKRLLTVVILQLQVHRSSFHSLMYRHVYEVRVRVRVTLRLAVYRQSIRLGAKPLETNGQIFFFQLNTYGHSTYVTSSLTRGWLCRLQLLLALASAFILRSEPRRTHDRILLFRIRGSPNLGTRSPYLYPPGTGWPGYIFRHWVPFPSPFTTSRATVEVIRTRLHTLEGQSAMPWRINSRRTEYKT